jgi:hypothetical protein
MSRVIKQEKCIFNYTTLPSMHRKACDSDCLVYNLVKAELQVYLNVQLKKVHMFLKA